MTTNVQKVGDALYSLRDKLEDVKELNTIPFKLGCIGDEPDNRDYQISSILSNRYSVKESIDYSSEMSPIKDQGNKPSCVGFAIASVLEWQQLKEYLNENNQYIRNIEHYDLSEQWIYHNAKEIDSWDGGGTSIRHGLKIVHNKGVPKEEGWPYSDQEIGKPKFWAYSTSRWNKNKKYYRINSVDEIKKTLREVGPCVIGLIVFYEFFYPNSDGVISYPEDTNKYYGGHAVPIIGDYPDKELFKIKNSWGTNWGNNGYGYLPYKYIEDFMLDAWVTIDADVKKIY